MGRSSDIDKAGDVAGTYTTRSGASMAYPVRHGSVQDLGTLGQTQRSSSAAVRWPDLLSG